MGNVPVAGITTHSFLIACWGDAIQAFGAIDLDVKNDNVDIMVSSAYKWQCGLEGAGP